MNICYISETHETCDFVKRIVIKIKKIFNIVEFSEDNGKTTITLPLFKSNRIRNKKIIKIAKRINKKLYDNNIENVVLSNYLEENKILKQKLYCQNINILDGRYLFYLLIPEIIEYILKRQKVKLQNGEVTLLINDFTQNNAKIITYIAQNVKRVNIVTNHSNKFKKIEDYFVNKFNNMSVVKHYRNKKERELEVLLIDKTGKDAERSEEKQTYQYLARNHEGKLIKGYFAAQSKLDVHSYLLDAGYTVYEIKTNKWINFTHGESKLLEKKMKNKDLVFWLAQLATYLKAGIPLTDAVKILAEQDKRKKYKKTYDSIIYELSMGESFSEALRKQGPVFPPLLINLIKAAELVGDLESTLDDMSEYYNEREATKKQMISALTYPIVILIFATIVLVFLLVYIVPKFADIYLSLNAKMNPYTQFLLDLSAFLNSKGLWVLVFLISGVLVFRILYKKLKAFRLIIQFILMHLPVVGKLMIYNEIHLFSKTFAMLDKNNVLLTDSIDILSKITNNEFYKMIMYDTISNLLRGDKISLSFKDNWAVPSLAYYMITTGESTGELGTMLEKVSDYYQREQKALATSLKALVEPILMVVLAVMVGGIMVAILVPMYDMGQNIL